MLKVKAVDVPAAFDAVKETLDEAVIVVGVPLSTH